MCGRYELHTPIEDVARAFDAALAEDLRDYAARYNIAPSLRVPVVREGKRGRSVEGMIWGLLSSWCKGSSGVKPINARADTIFDKPTFRNAVRRRRCLIPRRRLLRMAAR
jgi:putative SOS response-associated peptidase YedK